MKFLNYLSLILVISILIILRKSDGERNYAGYKVIKIFLTNERQVRRLNIFKQNNADIDFWTEPSVLQPTDVLVSADQLDKLIDFIETLHISWEESIDNVEKVLRNQRKHAFESSRQNGGSFDFKEYYSREIIYRHIFDLARQKPKLVKLEKLGSSFEGRAIWSVKVGLPNWNNRRKPAIWIEGGIHSREWVSIPTVLYILKVLTDKPLKQKLLQNLDWYLVPIANPDGYEYTHNTDRFWRKSTVVYPKQKCKGVDLNRNWNIEWKKGNSDMCREDFRGKGPNSEPEVRAMINKMKTLGGNLKAYVSIHSYGQYLLYPFAFSTELKPANIEQLEDVGERMVKAMEGIYATEYRLGTVGGLLGYTASGSAMDWVKGMLRIQYAYTIELPDKGVHGFLLPPEEIEPTGEEIWEGIKVLAITIMQEAQYG